jgi:uncharacterized membrane protein
MKIKVPKVTLSHAFRGTLGVTGMCIVVSWPQALSWVAAGACLNYALGQFRRSFQIIDAEAAFRRQAEATVVTAIVEQPNVPDTMPVLREKAVLRDRLPA